MKTLKITFAALACLMFVTSNASADIIAQDDFSYADGDLVANPAWNNHSGSASFIQVASGAAVFSHGGGSREDANINFGTLTEGVLQATFDVVVNDDSPIGGSDFEYFAHFFEDGDSNFRSRVDIVESATGDYTFGISESSTAEFTLTSAFSYGETVSVTTSFDFATGLSTLTVGGESISTTTAFLGESLDAFALRQSNSSNDEVITVDNLVIEHFSPIPEPGSAAVLAVAGLAAIYRRRR